MKEAKRRGRKSKLDTSQDEISQKSKTSNPSQLSQTKSVDKSVSAKSRRKMK